MLECTVLENVESKKYLGVVFTYDLIWNTHAKNVGLRLTEPLVETNFLFGSQEVKEAAYK